MSPIATMIGASSPTRGRVRGGASGGGGGSPAIAVTPTSGSLSLLQTGTNTVEFSLARSGGFTGVVTPVAAGLPTGVVASFSPATFGVGVTAVTMTLTATSAPLIADDAYTVTCSGSGVSDVVYSGTVSVIATPTYGPGPNAPAWSGKSVWPEELFNTPIPVHYAAPNAAGFKGWQGFEGGWGDAAYTPVRVTYPTVSTPIGTKPVMQVLYPGSSQSVNAVAGTSVVWSTHQAWGVRITGTWTGTLVFETSPDEVTWTPVTLRGVGNATGQQTTTNGTWVSDSGILSTFGKFRVRASSWGSGTAVVAVGMQGGEAAARMDAGGFSGNPTRIYTRVLVYVNPNWTNGGNSGTKFFFFSQDQNNNHYTGLFEEGASNTFLGLQGGGGALNRNLPGSAAVAHGTWLDVEFLMVANTPGVSNGVFRAWVNGVESQHNTDVLYFDVGTTPGFSSLWMDPTYGGGENPPPNANVSFRLAGWYRESAP